MKNVLDTLKTHKNLIPILTVALFFGLYLVLGLRVYRDYGISTDEKASYDRGQLNYERLVGDISQDEFMKSCKESLCFYPPLFEMVLYGIAHTSKDHSIIYGTRHLVTFLFFYLSVFFFFLLGKTIFNNWKLGLLGSLFLILSPRIFANSFYNPKDIPFLSAYIIAMFSMVMYIKKKNILFAILHGIAVGLACGIRTPGIVLIFITFIFLAGDLILSRAAWRNIRNAIISFSIFLIVTLGIIYISFPTLYADPITNYFQTFNSMNQFPWNQYQLYLGTDITNKLPWHYSIVWFGVSTPIFYIVLFFGGLVLLLINSRAGFISLQNIYMVAACGILPIITVIVMKSVLYTDNRQMFFCYPALLLSSVYGFSWLVGYLQRKIGNPVYQRAILVAILMVGLAEPLNFMLTNHPYEYVYFNVLAGPSMSVVKERFGLDTWFLAVKQGLEYILKTDNRHKIEIAGVYGIEPETGKLVLELLSDDRGYILPKPLAARLVFGTDDPDYLINVYRRYPAMKVDFPASKIYYSIKVGDADILTIYRLK